MAACASSLHHAIAGHHYGEIATYAIVFVPVWWAWMNYTWFSSAFDVRDGWFRLLSFVQMFGALLLAAGMKAFFAGDGRLVLVGYIVMRIAMVTFWLRVAWQDARYRPTALRYGLGILVLQGLWVGWYLVTKDMGPTVVFSTMLVFIAAELLIPVLAERVKHTPWHPHHIAERYGLLTIIVLGEAVLGVSNTIVNADRSHLQSAISCGFAGSLLVFLLWWFYFQVSFVGALHSHDLRRGLIFGYGHYLVFASLAAVGSGLGLVADTFLATEAGHAVSNQTAILTLAVAVTVYLLTVCLIRWLAVGQGPPRLLACLVALGLLTGAAFACQMHLPIWAGLLMIAAAPAALTTWQTHCQAGHGD
ncbi:MAG: low temperature requirement protein A [Planctomycetota bacterium]